MTEATEKLDKACFRCVLIGAPCIIAAILSAALNMNGVVSDGMVQFWFGASFGAFSCALFAACVALSRKKRARD